MEQVSILPHIAIWKTWKPKFLNCHPSEGFSAPVSASPSPRSHLAKSFILDLFFLTLDSPGGGDNHGGDGGDNGDGDGGDDDNGDVLLLLLQGLLASDL